MGSIHDRRELPAGVQDLTGTPEFAPPRPLKLKHRLDDISHWEGLESLEPFDRQTWRKFDFSINSYKEMARLAQWPGFPDPDYCDHPTGPPYYISPVR